MGLTIPQLAQRIIAAGLAQPDEIVGCNTEEIESVEAKFDIKLPQTYREWLEIMGRGAGHYLAGSDTFYPDILQLREYAEELLTENGNPFSLSPDAFVFLMHQGYQFLYFNTTPEHPDPPVMYYIEGEALEVRWQSLSDYYEQVLEDTIRLLQQL